MVLVATASARRQHSHFTPDAAGVDHIVEAEALFMDASATLVSAMIDAAWAAGIAN